MKFRSSERIFSQNFLLHKIMRNIIKDKRLIYCAFFGLLNVAINEQLFIYIKCFSDLYGNGTDLFLITGTEPKTAHFLALNQIGARYTWSLGLKSFLYPK